MIFTIGYEKLKNQQALINILNSIPGCALIDVRAVPFRKRSKEDSSDPKTSKSFSGKSLAALFGKKYVSRKDLGGITPPAPEAIESLAEFDSLDKHCLLLCKEHNPGACHRHHDLTYPRYPDAHHIIDDWVMLESDFDALVEEGDLDREPVCFIDELPAFCQAALDELAAVKK